MLTNESGILYARNNTCTYRSEPGRCDTEFHLLVHFHGSCLRARDLTNCCLGNSLAMVIRNKSVLSLRIICHLNQQRPSPRSHDTERRRRSKAAASRGRMNRIHTIFPQPYLDRCLAPTFFGVLQKLSYSGVSIAFVTKTTTMSTFLPRASKRLRLSSSSICRYVQQPRCASLSTSRCLAEQQQRPEDRARRPVNDDKTTHFGFETIAESLKESKGT